MRSKMRRGAMEQMKKERKMEKVNTIVRGANAASGPIMTPMHKSKVKSQANKAFGGRY